MYKIRVEHLHHIFTIYSVYEQQLFVLWIVRSKGRQVAFWPKASSSVASAPFIDSTSTDFIRSVYKLQQQKVIFCFLSRHFKIKYDKFSKHGKKCLSSMQKVVLKLRNTFTALPVNIYNIHIHLR